MNALSNSVVDAAILIAVAFRRHPVVFTSLYLGQVVAVWGGAWYQCTDVASFFAWLVGIALVSGTPASFVWRWIATH